MTFSRFAPSSSRHSLLGSLLFAASAAPLALGCVQTQPAGSAANASGSGSTALAGGGNLIKNADFSTGASLPWTPSFTDPGTGDAAIVDGWYCLNVKNKGKSPWDAQLRHREMTIQKGHTYTVRFKIKSSLPTRVRTKIGKSGPPYSEYWVQTLNVDSKPQEVTSTFTMKNADDATAEWAFHGGGNMAIPGGDFQFCIDDLYLTDPEYVATAATQARSASAVRINQLGYLPSYAKYATLVTDSEGPVPFEVVDATGSTVFSGQSLPFGADKDSGDKVHTLDFSSVTAPGKGYKIRAGGGESPSFNIEAELYKPLKYDALWFFYHNRSGIEIKMPYAGKPEWERPAGHLSDKKVPCAPDAGCNYELDVTGGWYDAGDHGKYVVNGGISLWTLLNLYERSKYLAPKTLDQFGDGKLRVPEKGNGVSDLLDEARWQMEFMLKMQVPDGQPHAGMAHHKIHDESWTALGLRPPTDTAEIKKKRFLRPVSTAATLNLAATAAQAARIWKDIDPAFAAKCKTAALKAWNAAAKEPKLYAQKSDTRGGGPYDDSQVSDEFYWAAAELFITTGNATFKDALSKSKWYLEIPKEASGDGGGVPSAMTWQLTAALGTISLAVVPNQLGNDAMNAARRAIIDAGDEYLKLTSAQGYRHPFRAAADGKYPWGSNSFVLNNMMMLGLANDFTHQRKYVEGVLDGMNYILGNNAMAQSYVSGYGSTPLENPHHRWFSYQYDKKFPKAIPGLVSGGPNSGLQDPQVQGAGLKGCTPQKCFLDHIEAWSVNEVTINWNAPFAWSLFFLDEKANEPAQKAAPAQPAKGGAAPAKPGSATKPKK
jgi:endoglucanase